MSQRQGWSDAAQVWVSLSTTAAFLIFAQSFQRAYSVNEGTPGTCLRLNTGTRKWDGCPKFQEQFLVGPLLVSKSFVSWLHLTHVGSVFCDSAELT